MVRGGWIDASRCVNDSDPITLKEWSEDSVTEDSVIRIPHESIPGRQWC